MLFRIIIILFIPVSSQYVQQECSLRSPRRKNHVKSGKIAKKNLHMILIMCAITTEQKTKMNHVI